MENNIVTVKKGLILALLLIMFIICLLLSQREYLLAGLTVYNQLVKSDAIVLMGGGFKERAPTAAKLYVDGFAPLVILANDGVFGGWSTKYNRNLFLIEWAEEELVTLGVPRNCIVKLPFYGSSTMFDVLAVNKYLATTGLKKIIVVTSDYHTRRTLWTFKLSSRACAAEIAISPAISVDVGSMRLVQEYAKICYYMLMYNVFGLFPELTEIPLKKM